MLFERPEAGRKALLLHVRFSSPAWTDAGSDAAADAADELAELVRSAGMEVCGLVVARRRQPHRRWFVGSGKLEEIATQVRTSGADVLVINHELSPGQQRNIEKSLNCGVLTRTELILGIFADRARTHEGQLQVELAQCRHAQSRLVRGWTHLDRQKGGVGLRGAGETQIELDQRMLDERIKSVQKKLVQVRKRRAQGRRARQRARVATVVLVGYTNAGKSTLFNALTAGGAVAEDRLFATLDPTMRALDVAGIGEVVLADTVGFIRDLPHSLVEAFKATLEEVRDADLLLLVVDGADNSAAERRNEVHKVLREIGADAVPVLLVYNKLDLQRPEAGSTGGYRVSAQTGEGLPELMGAIGEALGLGNRPVRVSLSSEQGRLHAWLHQLGAVLEESGTDTGGWNLLVRLDEQGLERLNREGVALEPLNDPAPSAGGLALPRPAPRTVTDEPSDSVAGHSGGS